MAHYPPAQALRSVKTSLFTMSLANSVLLSAKRATENGPNGKKCVDRPAPFISASSAGPAQKSSRIEIVKPQTGYISSLTMITQRQKKKKKKEKNHTPHPCMSMSLR